MPSEAGVNVDRYTRVALDFPQDIVHTAFECGHAFEKSQNGKYLSLKTSHTPG
jgi:hypothetical protein